jgi:hypothetical protein
VWRLRSCAVIVVAAWWALEELLVIGCNAAWLIRPWPRAPGVPMCMALFGTDLGRLGALVLMVTLLIVLRDRRTL